MFGQSVKSGDLPNYKNNGGTLMKWIAKDCPECGEKMVLITANFHFRPKLPFNFHCDKCGTILEYGMEPFFIEAKSFESNELAELLMQIFRSN
jgi:predicted RNA-binding Zn-ribbon protein involved in translation (DUF1610 family)